MTVVTKVDVDNIICAKPAYRDAEELFYTEAMSAITKQDGAEMATKSKQVIIRGGLSSSLTARAWYLYAAGQLIQGQKAKAIGALRMGSALEETETKKNYYSTLERFQGPYRLQLSELLEKGPEASLINGISAKVAAPGNPARVQFHAPDYRGWVSHCWFPSYGCYGYYCGTDQAWYYWYAPLNQYLPINYMLDYPPTPAGAAPMGNVPVGPRTPALPPGASLVPRPITAP